MQRKNVSSKLQRSSDNLRRAELTRFFRHQFGDEVIDIRRHIFESFGADLWQHTPAAMGRVIDLKYEVRRLLRIRTIAAADMSPDDIATLVREQNKLRERERRARTRAIQSPVEVFADLFNIGKLSKRTQAVFDVLSSGWMTTAVIEKKSKFSGVFQSLQPQALHRAVHRALQELQRRGLVQRKSGSHRGYEYRRSKTNPMSL